MNIFSRSFLFSCIFVVANQAFGGITILEKIIDLGTSPKDQTKYVTQGFAFTEGPETDQTIYLATFPLPQEKKLFFCICHKKGIAEFNVTNILTATTTLQITNNISLKLSFSPEVELFKQLIIALTRKDKKALQQLAEKNTIQKIEDCIIMAAQCEGIIVPLPKDADALNKLMDSEAELKSPVIVDGIMDFASPEMLEELAQALAAAAQQQN